MVGILITFWDGLFSGAMLVSVGVSGAVTHLARVIFQFVPKMEAENKEKQLNLIVYKVDKFICYQVVFIQGIVGRTPTNVPLWEIPM